MVKSFSTKNWVCFVPFSALFLLIHTAQWQAEYTKGSVEWNCIDEKEREKLGLVFRDDGEFWMPFDDFLAGFTELSICRLINTSIFSFSKTWTETRFFDTWMALGGGIQDRAGGCLNHPQTFLNNPQYCFDVVKCGNENVEKKRSNDDDDVSNDGTELIIQLSQRDTRTLMDEPKENLVIGFHVLRCEANRKFRLHRTIPLSAVVTSDYIKTKHIFLRVFPKLVGRYMIVPTTFNPGESTDFMLRIFSHDESVENIKHLDEEFPIFLCCFNCCCCGAPAFVTRVRIFKVTGLQLDRAMNTYCVIKCAGEKVKSNIVESSVNPEWKQFSAVFYRTKKLPQIEVQVWTTGMLRDTLIGKAALDADYTGNLIYRMELTLLDKYEKQTSAKISLEHETSDDFETI